MPRSKSPRTQTPVLLISDLPTWGRVALASAAPLVERAGFQACCLPTALLSTHGAYPGFVLQPQTEFLTRAWNHLASLSLPFGGAAIGLVGELAQFPLLEGVAQAIRASGGLVLVDPILGDNGKRYGLFHEDFVAGFRALLAHADVITPNLTEAALLLGEDPAKVPGCEREVREWTQALAALGPSKVVLTSAPFARPDTTGVAWFDRDTGRSGTVAHRKWGGGIPGTGDALAARLLAFLLRGQSFPSAVSRAVQGTLADLKRTRRSRRPTLWGPEGPLLP